jgi:hypothetical protein
MRDSQKETIKKKKRDTNKENTKLHPKGLRRRSILIESKRMKFSD